MVMALSPWAAAVAAKTSEGKTKSARRKCRLKRRKMERVSVDLEFIKFSPGGWRDGTVRVAESHQCFCAAAGLCSVSSNALMRAISAR